ncbi:MAG: type II toxin-antitoxin system HicB family antitoxin [Pirellulaceae bacterium]|nr:type II toxin-antitoxin system HicB family antitoxin [Pirellulaceae bacterium]
MANVTSDRYLIVIERMAKNLSAFSPDLPGCVATGSDRAEVEHRMAEAIRMHLDGLRQDGLPIPEPSCEVGYVLVSPGRGQTDQRPSWPRAVSIHSRSAPWTRCIN